MTPVRAPDAWFPATAPLRGVVLLTHGLNGNPANLDELARALAAAGFDVLRPAFHGHRGDNAEFLRVRASDWERDARHYHSLAWARAEEKLVPLVHVAYSMSGLIFQAMRDELKFDRRVLFAPALAMKAWYPLAMWIVHALPWLTFRSRIPDGYFANARSGFRSVKALHHFHRRWRNREPDGVPTLILAHPRDELVHGTKLRALAELHPAWRFLEVSTAGCTLPKRYHHLIVDSRALGAKEWERVTEEIRRFLSLP